MLKDLPLVKCGDRVPGCVGGLEEAATGRTDGLDVVCWVDDLSGVE